MKIHNYIRIKRFTIKEWHPAFLAIRKGETKETIIKKKTIEDAVEALIGAAYEEGGEENATRYSK